MRIGAVSAIALAGLACSAIYGDLRCGKLSNRAVLAAGVIGSVSSVYGRGAAGLADSLLGGGLGLLLLLPGSLSGKIGGGSLKLLISVGAIGGVAFAAGSLVLGCFVAVLMAVLSRGSAFGSRAGIAAVCYELAGFPRAVMRVEAGGLVPFAAAIGIGALLSLSLAMVL